jgi:hypothetical protein
MRARSIAQPRESRGVVGKYSKDVTTDGCGAMPGQDNHKPKVDNDGNKLQNVYVDSRLVNLWLTRITEQVLQLKSGMDKIVTAQAPTEQESGTPATDALVRRVGDDPTCGLAVDKESYIGLPHGMRGVVVQGPINGGDVF